MVERVGAIIELEYTILKLLLPGDTIEVMVWFGVNTATAVEIATPIKIALNNLLTLKLNISLEANLEI